MTRLRLALTGLVASASCLPLAAQARADETTIDALESCFDLADANGSAILAEQIPADLWGDAVGATAWDAWPPRTGSA